MLSPGDPAPWFVAPTRQKPAFNFSQVAGRYVVLSFFGSAGAPGVEGMLNAIRQRTDLFNDARATFFGVSNDPLDRDRDCAVDRVPGVRFFWDFGGGLARHYGLIQAGAQAGTPVLVRTSYVLDPALRVLAAIPFGDPAGHAAALLRFVEALPTRDGLPAWESPAPVLVVPYVFERAFCAQLVDYYERTGGKDSGFMESDPASGRTVGVIDYRHKRRRDCEIADEALCGGVKQRIEKRLVPALRRAFCFDATRIERYIVACYDAGEGGYFLPHRDNTTKGTAHRRFAVTLNLNAEDYEGGDLRFPEYGRRTYRAPTGGAVVFSCSLLHEATPVTRGRRFCVLPFLYDQAGADLRERNRAFAPDDDAAPIVRTPGASHDDLLFGGAGEPGRRA
jgi:peroxiredoxin/predicted 2-oxoglutarate/Fe(II)-dependent dioxygenase YbiX